MSNNQKPKLLILCTGNSCRSQMAEGLARDLFGADCDVYSAGTKPSFVHPKAIEAMKEIGIDISEHHSTSVTDYLNFDFKVVITVCDNAKEGCPVFIGNQTMLHWAFEDPAECPDLSKFREVRDQINSKFKNELGSYLK
jgi:arsenate reductase (thioredoxin)